MKKIIAFLVCVFALSAVVLVSADVPSGNTLLGSYKGTEDLKFYATSGTKDSGLIMEKNYPLPWKDSSDTGYYIHGTTTGALDEASNVAG